MTFLGGGALFETDDVLLSPALRLLVNLIQKD